jgi:hypothetical protein
MVSCVAWDHLMLSPLSLVQSPSGSTSILSSYIQHFNQCERGPIIRTEIYSVLFIDR